jgi:hypothetical protein
MLRKTVIVLATAAALTGGLTVDALARGGGVDRRKNVRLDHSQSPFGSRFRTLRHNCRRLRPHRHDPHHAQAARRKRLIMNPNFPDGLLAGE